MRERFQVTYKKNYLEARSLVTAIASRITKIPDVCGGDACIRGHRIPVWGIVRNRQLGMSDAEILECYPTITTADLEAAFEYYPANREEIEQAIQENETGKEGLVQW